MAAIHPEIAAKIGAHCPKDLAVKRKTMPVELDGPASARRARRHRGPCHPHHKFHDRVLDSQHYLTIVSLIPHLRLQIA